MSIHSNDVISETRVENDCYYLYCDYSNVSVDFQLVFVNIIQYYYMFLDIKKS